MSKIEFGLSSPKSPPYKRRALPTWMNTASSDESRKKGNKENVHVNKNNTKKEPKAEKVVKRKPIKLSLDNLYTQWLTQPMEENFFDDVRQDLRRFTCEEMRFFLATKGIKVPTRMKKDDLVNTFVDEIIAKRDDTTETDTTSDDLNQSIDQINNLSIDDEIPLVRISKPTSTDVSPTFLVPQKFKTPSPSLLFMDDQATLSPSPLVLSRAPSTNQTPIDVSPASPTPSWRQVIDLGSPAFQLKTTPPLSTVETPPTTDVNKLIDKYLKPKEMNEKSPSPIILRTLFGSSRNVKM